MPKIAASPPEHEARTAEAAALQRELLRHVPAWLKYRGLRQRDLAEALGVSEAAVSKWLRGDDAMKAGLILKIAIVLKAEPGDLLEPPPGSGLTGPVAETLAALEGLSADDLRRIAEIARLFPRKPPPEVS